MNTNSIQAGSTQELFPQTGIQGSQLRAEGLNPVDHKAYIGALLRLFGKVVKVDTNEGRVYVPRKDAIEWLYNYQGYKNLNESGKVIEEKLQDALIRKAKTTKKHKTITKSKLSAPSMPLEPPPPLPKTPTKLEQQIELFRKIAAIKNGQSALMNLVHDMGIVEIAKNDFSEELQSQFNESDVIKGDIENLLKRIKQIKKEGKNNIDIGFKNKKEPTSLSLYAFMSYLERTPSFKQQIANSQRIEKLYQETRTEIKRTTFLRGDALKSKLSEVEFNKEKVKNILNHIKLLQQNGEANIEVVKGSNLLDLKSTTLKFEELLNILKQIPSFVEHVENSLELKQMHIEIIKALNIKAETTAPKTTTTAKAPQKPQYAPPPIPSVKQKSTPPKRSPPPIPEQVKQSVLKNNKIHH